MLNLIENIRKHGVMNMRAKVEVIGGAWDGKEVAISNTSHIGRDSANEIALPMDRSVSRCHACLKLTEEGYTLEDLASSNGTFVDERQVKEPLLLVDGQVFTVGHTALKIKYQ